MLLCRIAAGATERMEVTVVPLQVGSGVAYPAKITYKADADTAAEQVPCAASSIPLLTPFQCCLALPLTVVTCMA